jgi:TolA-binding protein
MAERDVWQKVLAGRSARAGLGAAVGLVLTALGARDASAADACISRAAAQKLDACAGVDARKSAGPPAAIKLPAPTPPVVKPKRAPGAPGAIDPKEIRRQRTSTKSFQLLVVEVQEIESLVAQTPASSPDRPKLLRRLADSYVELGAAAFRTKIEARAAADRARADKAVTAARQAAIRHYTTLKDQHPRWCQDPARNSGCVDEVLYALAFEHEQQGDFTRARKVYYDLIQTAPKSRFVPNAYLAFGELFFQEAQSDPAKWSLAEQSYGEVTRYPAPGNTLLGYAHYKLAYVHWNRGDLPKALGELKKTIEFGAQYPAIASAKPLAEAARRDLVPIYASSGDAKKAYEFFRPLSGDGAGESKSTFKLLDALGQTYHDTGHYPEAIALYQDLMSRNKGRETCGYHAHIAEATLAWKSGDKDAIKGALDKQLEVERQYAREGHSAADKQQCANATAGLVTETAMAWHLEAVGLGNVRGTNNAKTMTLAADLYAQALRSFTKAQYAGFSFPKIVKEDWPTRGKVQYAMADLLYAQKRWADCGPAFDAVVADEPKGVLSAEASYASATCYQNAHFADRDKRMAERRPVAPGRASAQAKELTETQKRMLAAFDRYVCVVKPEAVAKDKAAVEQLVDVKIARARTYFEANRWEEAAAAFRDVAMKHPGSDGALYAADMYLEAANVLATRKDDARPACIEQMEADVPKLADLHCKDAKNAEGTCARLGVVQRGLERMKREGEVRAGAFEKAAEGYYAIWLRDGRDACEGKRPGCEKMDEVLYNAAKAFQAARLLAKAISVRKTLVDPRYHLAHTDLARRSVYDLGANYQAIAVYDEAAFWYERYARENPKDDKAVQALEDALVLRLGLGQEEQGLKNADLFAKTYGAKHPARAAHVGFAIGAYHAERSDWDKARRALSSAMRVVDSHGAFDVKVQAHALLGRVLSRTGAITNAATEYDRVRALTKDPALLARRSDGLSDVPHENLRKKAKVLTAVGEARFFFAELKRKEIDRIRFPEYKGSGRRDDVLRHINTKVADWIKKKRAGIEDVEQQYLKILELQPTPPSWAIAAGSRTGLMWGKFVAEFRAAPTPAEWKQKGPSPHGDLTWEEIRAAYLESIDLASEPLKQRAKAAFQSCLAYAVKYQYSDEHSRKCEEWLSKNYASEFHLIDELRGAPTRVSSHDPRPAFAGLAAAPTR